MPSPRLYSIPGGSNGFETRFRVSDVTVERIVPQSGAVLWSCDYGEVKAVQYFEARILHTISRRLALFSDPNARDSHLAFSLDQQVNKLYPFPILSRAGQIYYRACADVLRGIEQTNPAARAVRGFTGSLQWLVFGGGAAAVAFSIFDILHLFPGMSLYDASVRGLALVLNPKLWDALPTSLVPAALLFCLGLPYMVSAAITRSSSIAALRARITSRIVGAPEPGAVDSLPPDAD